MITLDLKEAERLEAEFFERVRTGEQVHVETETFRQHWIDRAETHWCVTCKAAYRKSHAWGDCPTCDLRLCQVCSTELPKTARVDARYCSLKCRKKASRVTVSETA